MNNPYDKFPADEAALMERVEELRRMMERAQQELAQIELLRGQGQESAAKRPPPLREFVLSMLEAVGAMVPSRSLGKLYRAKFGKEVPPERFGTLSSDERKAFEANRKRAVFLCHGLTFQEGLAIKRLWGRSDWELEARIVGPRTGRVVFLQFAAWINAEADRADVGVVWRESEMLKYLAADCAREMDLKVRKTEFHFAEWRAHALDELARIKEEDAQVRRAAAVEIAARAGFDEVTKMFGASTSIVEPTFTGQPWRVVK